MSDATFVCRVADAPQDDDAVVVEHAGTEIAVFHVEGEWFAVANRCTHQTARLSHGFLEGCAVECPLHASMFDLRTGVPSGPPATVPVRVFRTEVRDGAVYVVEPAVVS